MISRSNTARQRCAHLAAVGTVCLLVGCEEPQPTSFAEFMDDAIARDGTLARCNEDREATVADIECANARRAAAAIALRAERARREALEEESERKLAALRADLERERAAVREAQQMVEAAARAAYDAQWEQAGSAPVGLDGLPLAEDTGSDPVDAGQSPIPPQGMVEPGAVPLPAAASPDANTTPAPESPTLESPATE